jgi:CHASE3 domain sensor protein
VLERLGAVIAEKFAEMDRTIALKNERKDEDALAIFNTNRGKALMDESTCSSREAPLAKTDFETGAPFSVPVFL